jgi:hypothetical protein
MRKFLSALFAALAFNIPVFAQMGGGPGPGGGNFDNGMEKLFGANQVFTATMLTSIDGPNGPMNVKSKMVFDHENSWTEMNMADVHGPSLPPQAVDQMKSIGMDDVVTITPADKKSVYMIYPNIHSYVNMEIPPSAATNNDFKIQTTKLGEETVDGHHCVKNDVTITNSLQSQDFTVWNATDLNNFPIKIALTDQGMSINVTFQNISFNKPAADLFQPPQHYTKYGNIQDLMQSAMMNHPGAMPGTPSPGP